ncbi:DHA2 family efflux MFS transporter permease subunit [Paenibacillus xerothermodurans]|uniref:MFS transporter n=1 Tax=Paenibacillus xerothermodurans TaxID=1977292 RepID=A0A2W1NKX0_PAEXE|nr:DHA2 family efflux MFS transporter permease subunit [Paenibacillus xerothermodurans]PZE19673.1 MFS transporter [Paenibacillus xerothermodurans]
MSRGALAAGAVGRGPIFAVMFVGAFVAFLNQTLINIALPQIMIYFNTSATVANWLTTGFMLVNGIVIPVTAFLIERFSTRQLYNTSMALFAVGTLICGIAPTFSVLLIGRLVQAAGAGILFPLIMNVIFTLYPADKRGAAMGTLGIALNFAPAIGPTLSGWIVQTYSWRVLFFIILPIAVLNLIAAIFMLKNVTETGRPELDVLGVILSTVGFGGLLYAFATVGSAGLRSPEVITMFTVGGLALILFVWRQLVIEHPILEFRIFRYPMFTLTTIINVIITLAMFSAMILIPIYMQNVRGFSPLMSGLMLLPGGILMGIMSPITGRIFDRIGARWLAIVGLLLTLVTTYELTRLELTTSFAYVTYVYTARMFGMSLMMMPIFTAGLNELPLEMNRHGTAMVNTLRMVGGAVGTAFFVSIMTNQAAAHLDEIVSDRRMPLTDPAQVELATDQATVMGINDAFMVATILTVIPLVLSFFIRETRFAKNPEPVRDPVPNKV